MCDNCEHKPVCSIYRATGGVKSCEHHKEERKGKWVSNGICNHKPSRFRNPDKWTVWKCSECGYSNGRKFNANFCPNCGADMRGNEHASSC